jgi:DNA invertase Pin-like site-specific DNA recombinase
MRVALYARAFISDKNPVSCESQIRDLRSLAALQGWTVAAEYVEGQHQGRGARKAFQKIMHAASAHEFEMVLFWSLDRFCPEGIMATLHHLQSLISYGVNYRSLTEPFLDSSGPYRDAVIGMIAMIAAHEHRRRSERIQEGLAKARSHGRRGGRPRIPIDQEQIYQLRLQDFSLAEIAAQLGISKTTTARLVRVQNEQLLPGSGGATLTKSRTEVVDAGVEIQRNEKLG